MNSEESKKLEKSLQEHRKDVVARLNEFAKENPAVKGDFEVAVKERGEDEYDTAQGETDLDRDFALEKQLETELRDIDRALAKIKEGSYGKCDHCSVEIHEKRLQAMPVASFCISCARNRTG